MRSSGILDALSYGIGYGVLCAVANGGVGAVTGAVGAEVLKESGYPRHMPGESALMSAVGNGIVGGVFGFFGTSIYKACCGQDEEGKSRNAIASLLFFIAGQSLGGVLGYAILNNNRTIGTLGSVVADVAVGSGIVGVTIGALACFCCLLLCCCAAKQAAESREESTHLTL